MRNANASAISGLTWTLLDSMMGWIERQPVQFFNGVMNVWIHLGACGWIYPFLVGDWTFSRNDSIKRILPTHTRRLLDIIGKNQPLRLGQP